MGYSDDKTLQLVGKGTGGVSEMTSVLNEDDAFYCLVRIDDCTKATMKNTTRDIFISFFGPNMSIIRRGKKKSDLATVQKVMEVSENALPCLTNSFTHPLSALSC